MNSSPTTQSAASTATGIAAVLTGAGVLTFALFPLAIPILILTVVFTLPFLLVPLVVALVLALLAGLGLAVRALIRRLTSSRCDRSEAGVYSRSPEASRASL